MTATGEQKKLLRFIDRFPTARILVVGDVVLDHYIWGSVSRISPEAPVPVVDVTRESMLLGGAANVVNNIRSLGGKVSVCGVIGRDDAGRRLVHMIRSHGIHTDGLIVEDGRPTTIKTRVIAHSQQVVRFDREVKDGIGRDARGMILDFTTQKLREGIEAVILSDYAKGVITKDVVTKIVKAAKKKGVIVSVDPKVNHFGIYRGASVITPNVKEASIGSGVDITDERSLLIAGTKLLKDLRCDAVLITRGEHGMSLFERGAGVTHIPTVAREVFDVTGAGDTVISVLTLAMAAGAPIVDAARISNYAAGVVVGVVGTATVRQEELKRRIVNG